MLNVKKMSDQGRLEPDEAAALLAPSQPLPLPWPPEAPNVLYMILSVTAVFVVLAVATDIPVASQLAILEDIVCQQYYSNGGVAAPPAAADRCKIEPVQSEMAFINGWKDVAETLPGKFHDSADVLVTGAALLSNPFRSQPSCLPFLTGRSPTASGVRKSCFLLLPDALWATSGSGLSVRVAPSHPLNLARCSINRRSR